MRQQAICINPFRYAVRGQVYWVEEFSELFYSVHTSQTGDNTELEVSNKDRWQLIEEEQTVKEETKINKHVTVRYIDGSAYKTKLFQTDLALEMDDTVVVEVRNETLGLGSVIELVPSGDVGSRTVAANWVISKVDLTAHRERLNRLEKKRLLDIQINALKIRMDRRRKEQDDLKFYEMLAEKDPEMSKMLEELKALSTSLQSE